MNSPLQDLFLEELEYMYDAERRITKALPKLIAASTCPQLRVILESHLVETREHIAKTEVVFQTFDKKANRSNCGAMMGLLDEADSIVSNHRETCAINAAIILTVQKVEHYEIASYGCLKALAAMMGNNEAAAMLGEILEEEKAANEALNQLAAAKNEEAFQGAELEAVKS